MPTLPSSFPPRPFKRPLVLVAGGAGFLGSYICEYLLTFCDVLCVDNLQSGKRGNIEQLLQDPGFTFIHYDINLALGDLIRKRVDAVIHVAGIDQIARKHKAHLDELLVNTQGTRNLVEKALKDKAEFLLISTYEDTRVVEGFVNAAQARLFAESLTREYVERYGLKGKIVRVGNLFGPSMPLDIPTPLTLLIKGALTGGHITLSESKKTTLAPLYIPEIAQWIGSILLDKKTRGKIYNLVSDHSVTLETVVHLLNEITPVSVTFKTTEEEYFTSEAQKGIDIELPATPRAKLLTQFKSTLESFKTAKRTPPQKREDKKERTAYRFLLLIFLGSLFTFTTLIPLVGAASLAGFGAYSLQTSLSDIKEGNIEQAQAEASRASFSFTHAKELFSFMQLHFSLLGMNDTHKSYSLLLQSGQDAATSVDHMSQTALTLSSLFKQSLKEGGENTGPLIDKSISELALSVSTLGLLDNELSELEKSTLPSSFKNSFTKKRQELSEYRQTFNWAQQFLTLLPDMLGFTQKKTYLLLFQNNMELRPTGGFIGSYGLVTFDKGKLTAFDVYDVYSADGQMKGHVDPPLPIRTYLNQPNWFLRDSNWDVDFENSAAQSRWFLDKEINTKTQGTVALDVTQMQLLLGAIGPLSLADYKETVTADNLYEKMQTHAESSFFPGSTQKKDYMGAVARRVIDRILHEDHVPWLSILSSLEAGVSQKHVMFAFENEALQKAVRVNNWGGNILSTNPTETKVGDYRAIFEANLGINKANAFVKRKVEDEITIAPTGEMNGKLTATYTNNSQNIWPGGDYITYTRFLFPLGTKVTSIQFDGVEKLKKSPKDINMFDITEATESGKASVGFLYTIESKKNHTVALSYTLPFSYPLTGGATQYAYIHQKQPGIQSDPLTVALHFPDSLQFRSTNAQVFREKNIVTLPTDLSSDRLFTVEFLH